MTIESFSDSNIMPVLAPSVYVHPQACVIGDVKILEDASVWPMAVIRGDVNKITIGCKTNIQDNCVLHVTHPGPFTGTGFPLSIGNEVTIGHQATLHACTIEDQCLIGIGSTVLDGAVIEKQVMLGAHALVSPGKKLESGFLYLGAPARKVRALTQKEIDYFHYSADHYVNLKNQYMEKNN